MPQCRTRNQDQACVCSKAREKIRANLNLFQITSPAHGNFTIESDTPPRTVGRSPSRDPLLTAEEVAERLNVTKDWVWDHSSRKAPHLPVIRMGDGTLRYRASRIEEFIDERERLSNLRRRRG